MAKLKITETVLRDAHQSLLATRMSMDDMLPILSTLDKVGFYSAECWGGATFDSCLRFLNEDPWERLRTIRKEMPNTKLQMLFRGQNMLGYRPYADDVLEYFVQKTVANGIDIIRIFDALNDIRNLETAIKAAKKEGAEAQVAISYTLGDVFTDEYYANYAKQIASAGADSICIKDMAALLTPYRTESLVKAIKAVAPGMELQLHTHYTSGLASMCIMKAVEAGVERVDTAMSPLALGTSHAPTESIVAAFQGTEYDTGLDLKLLTEIRAYFMTLREKYIKAGLLDPKMLAVDANALIYQVPGGMLSNLLSQLKQAGKEDQLDAVLNEVPRVRKDSGMPPLVTPTSQIVGTQAVFNVIMGERYKMVTKEFKELVRGGYGKTPVAVDPEFQKMICKDDEPISCRPADLIAPELDTLKAECAQWIEQDEDVLSYAMFPKVAPKFFETRHDGPAVVAEAPAAAPAPAAKGGKIPHRDYQIVVNGQTFVVGIEETDSAAAPAPAAAAPAPAAAAPAAPAVAAAPAPAAGSGEPVVAPMPGTILDVKVNVGDTVKFGQVIMILEAMKMENEIVASKDGTVTSITVQKGASVDTNQTVATIG